MPNIKANVKGLLDNGNIDKVVSFGGGLQFFLWEKLAFDAFGSYMIGDTDSGKTNISGFSLGLSVNYNFGF